MNTIIRWEPAREVSSVREVMDRFFDVGLPRHNHLWKLWEQPDGLLSPALDMYETPDTIVVKASLPGVKPEEVEISITGNTLTIKGEIKSEEKVEEEDYYHQERRYGSFCRSVGLPSALKTDKANAVFGDGVLTLTIPKAEEIKPKTIKVETRKVIESKKS